MRHTQSPELRLLALLFAVSVFTSLAALGCKRGARPAEPDASSYREVTLEILGMT